MRSIQNSSVFDRVSARRWTWVPALAAVLCLLAWIPPRVRFEPPAARRSLERGAEDYLRQTARILGARFDEAFYRAAVDAQLRRPTAPVSRVEPASRECFARLTAEGEENVIDALAFLDQFGADQTVVSAESSYAGENPIDSFADRLLQVSSHDSPSRQAERLGGGDVPVSEYFLLLFSLLSFLASAILPTSPVLLIGKPGYSALEDFFARLARSLFTLCGLRVFDARRSTQKTFIPFRRTPLEEKRCTVLLR